MLKYILWFVIAFHMLLIAIVVVSFFRLPLTQPYEVAIPLMVWISYLVYGRVECPLTNLENSLRQRLGMKRIGGFVGHYCIRPVKIALGIKKKV